MLLSSVTFHEGSKQNSPGFVEFAYVSKHCPQSWVETYWVNGGDLSFLLFFCKWNVMLLTPNVIIRLPLNEARRKLSKSKERVEGRGGWGGGGEGRSGAFENMMVKKHMTTPSIWHKTEWPAPRDYDLREHIPHTWASSNDNLFQSNFSAWSNCEAILRKAPDWPI